MDAVKVLAVLDNWRAELAAGPRGSRRTWEDHAVDSAWRNTLTRCADDLAAALEPTPIYAGAQRFTAHEESDLERSWWAVRDHTWNGRLVCKTDERSARMIAHGLNAMPDLLAALKLIATKGGVALDYATIGNVARAAIVKAEGEA